MTVQIVLSAFPISMICASAQGADSTYGEYGYEYSACMYVDASCVSLVLLAGQKKVSVPLELFVMNGCEPLCECWERNPGPLHDQ